MTIREAIRLAIENGYPFQGEARLGAFEELGDSDDRGTVRFLDPLFWQALGKGMGWHEDDECQFRWSERGLSIFCGSSLPCSKHMGHTKTWKTEWHRLIDHLAGDGTIESYFKDLR